VTLVQLVPTVSPGATVNQVVRDHRVPQVPQDLMVPQGTRVQPDRTVSQGRPVPRDRAEPLVNLEQQEPRDPRDKLDRWVTQDSQGLRVPREVPGSRDHRACQVRPGRQDRRGPWVR